MERRVEVPLLVEISSPMEVPVPVEVPIYHELPQEERTARVAGGWVAIKGSTNSIDRDLYYGRKPARSKSGYIPAYHASRPKEFGHRLHQRRPGATYGRDVPGNPMIAALSQPSHNSSRSHAALSRTAPKPDIGVKLDRLKLEANRLMHDVVRAETSLIAATRRLELARHQQEARAMREHARSGRRLEAMSPLETLRHQQIAAEDKHKAHRELHEAAALMALRQQRLNHARAAFEEVQEAVWAMQEKWLCHTAATGGYGAMQEKWLCHTAATGGYDTTLDDKALLLTQPVQTSEAANGRESIQAMKKRHAAELAELLQLDYS